MLGDDGGEDDDKLTEANGELTEDLAGDYQTKQSEINLNIFPLSSRKQGVH